MQQISLGKRVFRFSNHNRGASKLRLFPLLFVVLKIPLKNHSILQIIENLHTNVQLGIKCTIGHSKLEIVDQRLGIGEQAGIGWNRLQQTGKARIDWNRMEQAGIGLYQHFPANSRIFQHIPSYSSLYPNPQSPIPNLQFKKPKYVFYPQLDILSVSSLIREKNFNNGSKRCILCNRHFLLVKLYQIVKIKVCYILTASKY